MKTALLAQNEALEAKTLNPDVKKSMIPLSHSVMYPVDIDGAILPCCCVEVVPSDSYRISNEILLRQLQPLKVPQMTRYTLNTAYFYCSNRLGWKKWEMFQDQAHKGRAGIDYSFELPTVATDINTVEGVKYAELFDEVTSISGSTFNVNLKNSLHTYFNVSHNVKAGAVSDVTQYNSIDDLPLAFPFFDYQMICRDFYTNIDRIDDTSQESIYDYNNPFSDWTFSNLFPVDDDEIKLRDGPQARSGYLTEDDGSQNYKGFILDKVRYHDLRADYFTSSKRAPMRGEAPSVDTTVAVGSVDAKDVVFGSGSPEATNNFIISIDKSSKKLMAIDAISQSVDKHGSSGAWEITGSTDNWTTNSLNEGSSQNYNYSDIRARRKNSDATSALKEGLEKLHINLETTKSINAAELILMTQLTLWQTLNMLSKPTYNDFLRAHFDGVHVGDSLAEKPQYIGGTSQVIDINEVLQTSASTDSSKLGTQGAVAHSLSSSYVGTFFAQDYGFIIGVMYIIPDVVYNPAMPRWASRRTVEDYYFPEFANLSMQATLNKELFYSNDDEWNNQPLGYVGAYDELRSIPNYCAGLMLDDTGHSELSQWLVRRTFSNDNKPAINQRFLSAKGNVDKSAWSVPNEPKFMFQCANYIEAMRPMPWLAIPHIGQ